MKKKKLLYLGLDPSRYKHDGILTHLPLIRIVSQPFDKEVKKAFLIFANYTHVIFTSRTAVSIALNYLSKAKIPLEHLQRKTYICVGPSTASVLEKQQIPVAHIAKNQTGEGVVEVLKSLKLKNAYIFFPHSALARGVIAAYLTKNQVAFSALVLYDNFANQATLPPLAHYDEIIFTSPSTVKVFAQLCREVPALGQCRAIGPVTQKALDGFLTLIHTKTNLLHN